MYKIGVKRTKYGNKRTVFNGITFDSERERDRYLVLKEAQDKGIISKLEVHRKFELIPAIRETYTLTKQLKTKVKVEEKERTVQLPITYTCDFSYVKDNQQVIEDVKPSKFMIPKEYFLKEKLLRWRFGLSIRRVYKAGEPV